LIARGFASRAALIGISRGGLYAHRYAAQHPDRVAVIYGDAPVLDFKSWPGGRGKGKGSPGDWETLKRLYHFADDAAAVAFEGNPIDTLATLADHKIALIYVAGDADDVVPFDENALVAQQRFEKLGGRVVVIRKPGVGHHPHGLDDPAPVVEFIRQQIDR
jgi:pimeloyl-ACP methyl ester carboxylesterase